MSNNSSTGGLLIPLSLSPPLEDMDLDAIFQQFIVGITGLSGTLVRPRWQPETPIQPEPLINWCSIGVVSETQDANSYNEHVPDANGGAGMDRVIRWDSMRVLATFYGLNAKTYAALVRDGIYVEQNNSWLRQYGIAFTSSDSIRATPELINEQWVKRYDLPLNFKRVIIRNYDIQNILTADITIDNEIEIVNIHIQEE